MADIEEREHLKNEISEYDKDEIDKGVTNFLALFVSIVLTKHPFFFNNLITY